LHEVEKKKVMQLYWSHHHFWFIREFIWSQSEYSWMLSYSFCYSDTVTVVTTVERTFTSLWVVKCCISSPM